MMVGKGIFVVSLDFELYWGVRDIYGIERYKSGMAKERNLIPQMLEWFEAGGIHATWATVGLLFFESREELLQGLPALKPSYEETNLSPYAHIESAELGLKEEDDPYHYALSLIRLIRETSHQTVSTHTFSHYYCKETGQNKEQFAADLEACKAIAAKRGMKLESIVFPRNQVNEQYLSLLLPAGINVYRGNPQHPIYKQGYSTGDSSFRRAYRLLDTYWNLSGYHTYPASSVGATLPVNLPASQFLRSYSHKLKRLEPLRLKRILDGMTYAAKHNEVYHLWWHPYNLADEQNANMRFLERIISHYCKLKVEYGMESMNMEELRDRVLASAT
ncbi:polysaccharide deacetylase family protein [Paenibacillus sp. YAF4_2]|uniref:polysaccharide deacetylase family protein n=1 Tax=Paenibacillus sp. YAF4_2 TaxID=3233085 RepID=UPI003F99BF82